MFNRHVIVFLSAFTIGLMGLIDTAFALLSFLVFHDDQLSAFLTPGVLSIVFAVLLKLGHKSAAALSIKYRDALLFASVTWLGCGVLGAVPIITITDASFTDGVFESISGLTTTGATILSGLDLLPPSFLLYRQFLQWVGGLGIVIFVVAVLPMLNVGGMRLLKAEMPGPVKDDKLSPRIANTTHHLWLVYVLITLLCMLGYYFAGMNAYEAIAHSLTTVSTGGFSTHDASLGYFNSPLILFVANVFMLAGAVSYTLHFRVWQKLELRLYGYDEETRVFVLLVVVLSLLVMGLLWLWQPRPVWHYANLAVFHVISFITSTGYTATNCADWPTAATFLLLFAGYLGGCAGSTAGGNKIIRTVIATKVMNREVKRLLHPAGVFVIRYQHGYLNDAVLSATMSFLAIAAAVTAVLTVLLMMTGLDFWSALSAVAACVNVLGPGFGALGTNFQCVSDTGTWLLSGAMILGRLEYFSILALVLPSFWRL